MAVLLVVLAEGASAVAHVDDAGKAHELRVPPRRIVTLAPNLTEFVYAVGAGATLVGTVDTSHHPPEAARVPRVGDHQRIDVEKVLALAPDLILVWLHGNQGRELAQLEAAGLRLFYLEPRRLDDIPRALSRLGALLGQPEQAAALAARWRSELESLRARYAAAPSVSVFFQVWPEPLMTLNGQHLTSDLISLCGGRNVFADLPALAPQISVESVVAIDPEVILGARESSAEAGFARESQRPSFATWRRFPALTAVRRGWIYTVHGDLVTRQGPRAIEGARAVCAALDQVRAERRNSR